MKKTLIALAAVAVTSTAMAQVTISGKLTFDAMENSKTTTQVGTAAATTSTTDSTGAQNGLTTSEFQVSGKEDLGSGITASFQVNSGMAGTGIGDRDTYLNLAGDFGSVRVGRFIPAASYGYYGYSGAATTQVGSVYNIGTAGSSSRIDTTGVLNTAGTFERNSNQLQYSSPSFNGLTFNVNYGSTSTDTSAYLGEASTKQQGFSVAYASGPLSIAAGKNTRNVDAEGSSATASGVKIEGDLDWIGVKYNMGVAVLNFTNVQRKDQTAAAATGVVTVDSDISLNSFGVSVPMGALTFSASMYSGENDVTALTTDNLDLSGNQLMVNYALSKRTSIYAVTGMNKSKLGSGNTTTTATKTKTTSVGMNHSF
jgi:predicted porin